MHEPFPIADYTEGLSLAKEPFLSPTNAYRELTNGRVFRGRLEKRKGHAFFGYTGASPATVLAPSGPFGLDVWFEGFQARDGTVLGSNTNGEYIGFAAGSVLFELGALQAVLEFTNTKQGTNILNTVDQGVIGEYLGQFDYFRVRWSDHPDYVSAGSPDISTSTMTYNTTAALPITGISALETATNTHLFAFDTQSAYVWNDTEKWFEPQDGPGLIDPNLTYIFTLHEDSDDFVWTWPVGTQDEDYLVFTNGLDPVYRWTEGASPPIEAMPVDINPVSLVGIADTITTALLVLTFGGRMIYLLTTEDGTRLERRARWTIAGSFETFDEDGLGWADAPSPFGAIKTAGFIGERLYVGFENGWMELKSTGDPISPFEWLPIISRFGAIAKLTTIQDSARLLTRSSLSMQAVDPNGQYEIDEAIPDLVTHWSPDRGGLSAAARNEQDRELWWSYVGSGATEINAALVGQYDEKGHIAWSEYDTDFRVFGSYVQQDTLTWDELPGTWQDYATVRWDDQDVSTGFPIFLGGKIDGAVYRIGLLSSDDSLSFSFDARTQAISPYPGQRSHLGWLDVYAEATPGSTVDFTFYDNVGAQGYLTKTVDFSPTEPSGKVYRRVRVGHASQFHQILIHTEGTTNFAIDAIVPWFRPAGRVKDFG